MYRLVLNIKDESKADKLVEFLKDLDFIEISKEENKISREKDSSSFKKLFGIWKGRDISIINLRDRAWKRNTK